MARRPVSGISSPKKTTPETTIDTPEPIDGPFRSAVVGVLVHNEDPTIETCLQAILSERDGISMVRSVVVVASGCTDLTEEIVRRVARQDSRVRLIVEPQRSGKAAAINLLLRESSDPIVVVLGGDVIFTPGSLVRLLEPFRDPSVGMTGVRPIPTNARVGIVGNAVHLLWDMHHEVSLIQPKMGEAVAFRRVLHTIDPATLVDEATMEHEVLARGLKLRYVPTAIVRNHGPETLRDFMAQRTRVYSGHLALASATGHRVSSMNGREAARAAWRLWRAGQAPHYMITTIAIEATARAHAWLLRLTGRHRENGMWHPIASSKRVLGNGHVLRAHHELRQRLQLTWHNSSSSLVLPTSKPASAVIRGFVRAEDRLRVNRGNLAITFRSDADGARALQARLEHHFPDSEIVVQTPVGDAQLQPAMGDAPTA